MNSVILATRTTQAAESLLDRDSSRTLQNLLHTLGESLIPQYRLHTDQGMQDVLLDTFVDGIRYVLIRIEQAQLARAALSPREQEIAHLIAKGLPNKAIASLLEISPWTVATHVRRIFIKLQVGSRAEMIAQMRINRDYLSGTPVTDIGG